MAAFSSRLKASTTASGVCADTSLPRLIDICAATTPLRLCEVPPAPYGV